MKKRELLENDSPDFNISIIIISFFVIFSIFLSFLKIKFFKPYNLEQEILFSSIFSFIIELSVILYLFFIYPFYFVSLLNKNMVKGFLKGFFFYPIFVPPVSILTFLSYHLFKKFGLKPLPQEIIFLYTKIKSPYILSILLFFSCIIAPFFEEIIFRGFIYPSFKKKFTIFFSIFLSALIFSLFHFNIFVMIGVFLLGVILAYLFEKTENIWTSIGFHFANNFFVTLFIMLEKNNLNKF